MEQMEFNLLDEPWIRVMTEDCTVVERSLMQVLLTATGISGWRANFRHRMWRFCACCWQFCRRSFTA